MSFQLLQFIRKRWSHTSDEVYLLSSKVVSFRSRLILIHTLRYNMETITQLLSMHFSLTKLPTNISKYATCLRLYDLVLSHFSFLLCICFILYCPWVVWSGSELNSWLSSHSNNLQGDPRTSRFRGISFWPTTSKVERSHSFHMTAFT